MFVKKNNLDLRKWKTDKILFWIENELVCPCFRRHGSSSNTGILQSLPEDLLSPLLQLLQTHDLSELQEPGIPVGNRV